jgi:hypothetical protein
MEREPRHIVRDVEGLLKTRIGINVFYKKIGVVQVVDNEIESGEDEAAALQPGDLEQIPAGEEFAVEDDFEGFDAGETTNAVLLEEVAGPRVRCTGVGVLTSDTSVRAEVDLQAAVVEARGVAEGPNHADSDIVLVARAAVAAVRQLVDEAVLLNLSDVRVIEVAGQAVMMAGVELVEGRRSERLFGTCPAGHNRHQAAVYAILDALNRRLAFRDFKTGEVT